MHEAAPRRGRSSCMRTTLLAFCTQSTTLSSLIQQIPVKSLSAGDLSLALLTRHYTLKVISCGFCHDLLPVVSARVNLRRLCLRCNCLNCSSLRFILPSSRTTLPRKVPFVLLFMVFIISSLFIASHTWNNKLPTNRGTILFSFLTCVGFKSTFYFNLLY